MYHLSLVKGIHIDWNASSSEFIWDNNRDQLSDRLLQNVSHRSQLIYNVIDQSIHTRLNTYGCTMKWIKSISISMKSSSTIIHSM